MDWVEEDGRAPHERADRESWREPRSEVRSNRKGLEERLEGWVSRGRDLVDGVSGARPGTRPVRPGERLGQGGRSGLDGLGRWVEGRLDWLLDDRDDWREPWQEGERSQPDRWEPPAPPPRSSRAPLQAISRRGIPPLGQPSLGSASQPMDLSAGGSGTAASQEWPEEEAFSVSRWRREEPSPPRATNPLAAPPPPSPPGRPLPRSTRRR